MRVHTLRREQLVRAELPAVFEFFSRTANLETLHLHEFEARPDGTLVRDEVLYALPLSPLGDVAHPLLVKRDLRRIFDYRRTAVGRILEGGA